MDNQLYVAMSGAKQVLARVSTNSNNLANINTTGFKEDLDETVSFKVAGQKLPTRVYVDVNSMGINGAAGNIMNTGRELDIAIDGDGLIAIKNPDGSEAYTRAGNLRINTSGILETIDGSPVLGNNGPISISPYEKLEISKDGTISIVPPGDTSGSLVVLDRIKLVNPDTRELRKNENGTLELRPQLTKKTTIQGDGEGGFTSEESIGTTQPTAAADASVGVISGALETSNVNTAKSLVSMVELSRLFELQMRLMKTAEENDTAINRILT